MNSLFGDPETKRCGPLPQNLCRCRETRIMDKTASIMDKTAHASFATLGFKSKAFSRLRGWMKQESTRDLQVVHSHICRVRQVESGSEARLEPARFQGRVAIHFKYPGFWILTSTCRSSPFRRPYRAWRHMRISLAALHSFPCFFVAQLANHSYHSITCL